MAQSRPGQEVNTGQKGRGSGRWRPNDEAKAQLGGGVSRIRSAWLDTRGRAEKHQEPDKDHTAGENVLQLHPELMFF